MKRMTSVVFLAVASAAGCADDPADWRQLEGCRDVRHRGDGKVADGGCWDPPGRYCSQGPFAAALFKACSPDRSECCVFPTNCLPCGWTECCVANEDGCGSGPDACDGAATTPDAPICGEVGVEICYDGIE